MPSSVPLANARGSEALILSRDPQGAVGKKSDDPSRIEKTASEFESLLITQLLQSMRTESGWLGTGEDSSSSSLIELAEQQLASAMSAQGGLGLAKLVAQGLQRP